METLLEMRQKLDEIDTQITELYEKRMEICGQVADYKIKNGKKVLHTTLETEKQNVEGARVVFQGVEGAYSQAAMEKFFGSGQKNFHVPTFRDAMVAIEEGTADYAVLPIENSTAGAVDQVYDLLVEFENYIVGEVILPVRHQLAGLPGVKISQIKRVYSHPQGLMQSARCLDNYGDWEQISVANTAVAAKKVLEEKTPEQAAVCSEYAAKLYGLEILEQDINAESDNSTRFIVITNQKVFLKHASKISICMEVPHESGSLYHLLSHFIYNDLNMTKIESRPIAAVKYAIRGLSEEALNLKILGNY